MKLFLALLALASGATALGADTATADELPLDKQPVQIHCELGLRAFWFRLEVGMDPLNGYLAYSMEGKDVSVTPPSDLALSGANTKGFAQSRNAGGTVGITVLANKQLEIEATGDFKADLGQAANNRFVLKLAKTPAQVILGDYEVVALAINGQDFTNARRGRCTLEPKI